MTDREIIVIVVAFIATWTLVAVLAYVIEGLRSSLLELGQLFRDFVADVEDDCL